MTDPPPDDVDRRAIIHIGWPKTATTSMQRQMAATWPNVAGRPWRRPGGTEARTTLRALVRSHKIDGRFVQPADLDRLLDASWHDASRPVLLSDEGLVSMPPWKHEPGRPDSIDIPGLWVPSSWQRTVVATLREPRSMLRSTYRYSVRSGFVGNYRRHLGSILADLDRGRGPMSFAQVLRAWEQAVGAESVVVTWMEDFANDHHTFWKDLAAACDVPGMAEFGHEPSVHLNKNRHAPLWLERGMNMVFAPHQGKRRSALGRRVRRFYNHKVSRHMPKHRRPIEAGCEELEDHVVDRIEREVDVVCERYGTHRPYERRT